MSSLIWSGNELNQRLRDQTEILGFIEPGPAADIPGCCVGVWRCSGAAQENRHRSSGL